MLILKCILISNYKYAIFAEAKFCMHELYLLSVFFYFGIATCIQVKDPTLRVMISLSQWMSL